MNINLESGYYENLDGGSQGGAVGGANGGARKRMYKEKHCSPGENDVEGSCLDDDIVIKVGKAINRLANDNKKLDKVDLSRSPEDIHGDICAQISKISKCSSEVCWQKIKSLMKELGPDKDEFTDSFKPLFPKSWLKDYNEWLDTGNIELSLSQHLDADKSFYFYGAVPIDFKKCSVSNLCGFDMKKHLDKGETKIGIVFNTDPSTKDGQHWISLYMDLGKHNNSYPGIYYFDSFGKKPPKEIKELIKKAQNQGQKCNCEPYYFYNDYSYQKRNSQCGMYAIHFIKKMLEGLSFEEYLNTKLTDQHMIDLRKEYFIKI
tara:strand:+ start:650 stop:1603 length:954 start_codon:yes stop_codon:yes gene_type:complete